MRIGVLMLCAPKINVIRRGAGPNLEYLGEAKKHASCTSTSNSPQKSGMSQQLHLLQDVRRQKLGCFLSCFKGEEAFYSPNGSY